MVFSEIVNVSGIVPLSTLSPPRFEFFATFNIILPVVVSVGSTISPTVIPDGNTPTETVQRVCVNPT